MTEKKVYVSRDAAPAALYGKKGGMLKAEYNDDFTDDVTELEMGMRYLYIPPTVNG